MPPPQATENLYRILQQYQLMLLVAGRRLWSRMAPDNFDGSWLQIAPQMVAFTAGAQLAAAQAGVGYVPAVLEETGQPDEPDAAVRPQAFSGRASDGRSLPGLLEGAVVASKRAVVRGLDGGDALAYGRTWLEQALQTAVTDAARDATAASIIARPGIGWVRVVNPPCCSRCAVLAGRFYRWNEPLKRHPQCDCLNQPTSEADADRYIVDPRELVRRGQVTDLTRGQRERLDEGADLVRVLNESRDAWRVRMEADRRAARRQQQPASTATVRDFMASLTSRVEAVDAMRAAGIAN